jgi:hypothetical protein
VERPWHAKSNSNADEHSAYPRELFIPSGFRVNSNAHETISKTIKGGASKGLTCERRKSG